MTDNNQKDKRPNILVIMADDHASKAVSAYNSRLAEVFKTPHLDSIAEEGCRLDNCLCSNAICTPSRAVILTGKSSHITGVKTLSDVMDREEETFPRILQRSGYNTALFGKWHLHSEPRGFDEYSILPGQGVYFNPSFIEKGAPWPESKHGEDHEYPDGKQETGYVTDIITDKCISWLKEREEDKPFLMFCHHKAPHDDFEYHPRDEHLFDGVEIPEPGNLWEDKSHRSVGSRDYGTTVSEHNPRRNAVQTMSQPDYVTGQLDIQGLNRDERTKAAYQKYLKDYLRVCKGIDDNVGRLLDCLDEEGLTENTIVIYTSDQGMFLGEHDYIDKRWIYEEAMQMPFLVRWPGRIRPGTVMDSIVGNLDFAPTFLDIAGEQIPSDMQGRSFLKILEGEEPEDWDNICYNRYWMHMAHHDVPAHFGIRTKEYKLVFFYGLPLDAADALPGKTPPGWELYDLIHDPDENRNVYNDPAYKGMRDEAVQRLFALRKDLGEDDSPYPELVKLLEDNP
ncbi:MAG: sulfatase [Spirochaetales bacterium]|nr:sulfatase [Spirochaetales bacterium]